MKKVILIISIALIPVVVFTQERDVALDYINTEIVNSQVNELLNYPVLNLSDNKKTRELKKKLNSELNTVASCVIYYKYSEILKLSNEDQYELKLRIEKIAEKFIENKNYVLFELSGGYAPIFGVKEEMISGQKISTVMLGGDCTISDVDLREEEIYSIFNNKIKKEINK